MTKQKDKIKLSSLQKNKKNPRYITAEKLDKLKASIESFEQMLEARPIVTDENGVILGGNMRYEALKALGYKEIPAAWVKTLTGLTDEQKREFLIKDNVGFGAWDWDTLANEWESELLTDWGLDVPVMEYEEQTELEAKEDDYQAPENMKIDVMQGDLIEFKTTDGRTHRLLCGDSTNSDDVEKLMQGKKADICFTSPPYNAGKSESLSGNTHMGDNKYSLYNDNQTKNNYLDLLYGFTSNALINSGFLCCNIQMLAGNKIALLEYLNTYKNNLIDVAIWDKLQAQPAMAKNVFNSRFEFLIFLHSEEKPSRAIPNSNFRGTLSNVYAAPPQKNNEFSKYHAATFPLHLPEFILNNFTKEKNIILDPFLGSGSTLVAAHQLKRTCYGLELEPKYCQVIIDRMQKLDNSIEVTINGKAYEQQAEKIPF